MFLVVDANILFSCFSPSSARRKLIGALPRFEFKLISPDFAFEELAKDKVRVRKYSGITELEFIIFFSLLEKKIEPMSKLEYDKFLSKAKELSTHTKDIPYFASALSLNCAIWSDEKAFKQQSKVKVYNTSDLLKEFGLK